MAWESRRSSRYYYRKRKVAGKVVTEYVGSGFDAEMAAMLDQQQREQHAAKRAAELTEQRQQSVIDEEIDFLGDLTSAWVGLTLLLTGHRKHKRQWRKKRNANGFND